MTDFQMGQDKDIARIVEMGFSASQANQALKQSNGDVVEAINDLLSGNRRPGGDFSGRRDRGGEGKQDRIDIPSREDRRERGLLGFSNSFIKCLPLHGTVYRVILNLCFVFALQHLQTVLTCVKSAQTQNFVLKGK